MRAQTTKEASLSDRKHAQNHVIDGILGPCFVLSDEKEKYDAHDAASDEDGGPVGEEVAIGLLLNGIKGHEKGKDEGYTEDEKSLSHEEDAHCSSFLAADLN